MMDFSTLQELTIPEGKVTQIADASGRVLWSGKRTARVTVTTACSGISGETAKIIITSPEAFAPDPSKLDNKVYEYTVMSYDECLEIEIPTGSTIECVVSTKKANNHCCVILNGEEVLSGPGTYLYTVTTDVLVDVYEKYIMGDFGVITIVENPDEDDY